MAESSIRSVLGVERKFLLETDVAVLHGGGGLAPTDGFLAESDRLLGRLPSAGELVQGPRTTHGHDQHGVDGGKWRSFSYLRTTLGPDPAT